MKYIRRTLNIQKIVVSCAAGTYEITFLDRVNLEKVGDILLENHGIEVGPEGYVVVEWTSDKVQYRMPVEEFIKKAEAIEL